MQDGDDKQKPPEPRDIHVMRPLAFKKAASRAEPTAADIDATVQKLQVRRVTEERLRKNTEDFLQAIAGKDTLSLMRTLLKEGIDLDFRDEHGNGLLHKATGERNLVALKLLIRAGADLHAKNADGITPLLAAAACYGMGEAGVLLAGADPDLSVHTVEGYHALHLAAGEYDKTRLVEVMLQRGVPADIRDPEGRPPLLYAVARKREAAEVLCMAGGFHAEDMAFLKEALAIKPQYGDNINFELLLEYAGKQDAAELQKSFPKMDAAVPEPPLWEAEELFDEIRSSDSGHYMYGYRGTRDTMKARDHDGKTPLMIALASHNGSRNADALWESDARARDKAGRTPLHHAAENACAGPLKDYLIDRGNVDAQDVFGRTPLMMAVIANSSETVEALLEGGADPEVEDRLGLTVYDLVKIHDRKYVEESLPEREERPKPRFTGWEPR